MQVLRKFLAPHQPLRKNNRAMRQSRATVALFAAVLHISTSSWLCEGFLTSLPTTMSQSRAALAAAVKMRLNTGKTNVGLRMTASQTETGSGSAQETQGNILILDHVNINHEKGRHDLLKTFYYDVLGFAADPRKAENIEKGKKTLWANCGINQLHLPEMETAQVLDGKMVVEYSSLDKVAERLASPPPVLAGSKFGWKALADGSLAVTCPWGNTFELKANGIKDPRGVQPGEESEPLCMPEVTINVPHEGNMAGIARFYRELVGAEATEEEGGDEVRVRCGPRQMLRFRRVAAGTSVEHSDYHLSMYVSDFPGMFQRMEALNLIYVNPRFKRKAETLEQAQTQCMFRVKDIVDPAQPEAAPSIVLEHEIRSTVNLDGTPYKSCPFY